MSSSQIPVIAFSGPPRSGKDTLANLLKLQLDCNYDARCARVQLSYAMRLAVFGLMGMEYAEKTYEELKDAVIPLFGRTLRAEMISLSEEHIKPLHGKEFWVRSGMSRVPASAKAIIISDLGFPEEIRYLESTHRHVLVVAIDRKGCTWVNDSRIPVNGKHMFGLDNNGSPNAAVSRLRNYLRYQMALDFGKPISRI